MRLLVSVAASRWAECGEEDACRQLEGLVQSWPVGGVHTEGRHVKALVHAPECLAHASWNSWPHLKTN